MCDQTFDNFDKFERKKFAERLTTVISTFFPFSDDAFVLSLNAKFGSGKTIWKKTSKDSKPYLLMLGKKILVTTPLCL